MRRLAVLAGALLAGSSVASSQQASTAPLPSRTAAPAFATPDTSIRRIALTVSGGVSLGNYQAGATYAFIHILRHQESLRAQMAASLLPNASELARRAGTRKYQLDVLTGASAGNANAVLAAIDYCSAVGIPDPEESLYWKLWTAIGYDRLMIRETSAAETGIFSQRAFDPIFARLEQTLATPGGAPRCSVVLGLTATKLTPVIERIVQGVEYPVQRHAGVFRLTSDASGMLHFVQPRLGDVDDPKLSGVMLLDPVAPGSTDRRPHMIADSLYELPLSRVRSLVEASGAFPVAFTPRQVLYFPLATVDTTRGILPPCPVLAGPRLRCAEPSNQLFVDGGVFDNRPMGLALGLGDSQLDVERSERQVRLLSQEADSITRLLVSSCAVRLPAGEIPSPEDTTVYDSARTVDSLATANARRALEEQRDARLKQLAGMIRDLESECATRAGDLSARQLRISQLHRRPGRMLYYIDEEPLRLGGASYREISPERYAGLLRTLGFGANVFSTSSNAELRMFAEQLRRRGDVTFAVNTRWSPLMAEHMQHFGSFFARSFRELDFYTGVYDGLRSAFRALYCPDSVATPADSACEVTWTRLALADTTRLRLTQAGRAVVTRLLDEETRRRVTNDWNEPDPRARALVHLLRANINVRRAESDYPCNVAIMLESPLCELNLVSIVREWRASLADLPGGWRMQLDSATFGEDAAFVGDPQVGYNAAMIDVMERLRRAEQEAHRQGSRTVAIAINTLAYVEQAHVDALRSCGDGRLGGCVVLNPNSASIYRGGAVASLLPNSYSALLGGGGQWFGWRPTWYARRMARGNLALVAPLELAHDRTFGWYGLYGAGLHLAKPGFLESGVTSSVLFSGRRGAALDISAQFLAGLIRAGGRFNLRGQLPGGPSLGVGDVNGLVARLVTLDRLPRRQTGR